MCVCVFIESCMWSLYIFEIVCVCYIICKIFSQFVGCLFALFMVYFIVQKLIGLIRSLCLFLLLSVFPMEIDIRKYWYNSCLRMFYLFYLVGVLWCHVLYVTLQGILNLFLCLLWGSVLTSLIYMCCSAFPISLAKETVFSLLYVLVSFAEG